MKKTLVTAIVLGMTLSGAAGVYAGSKLEKITAYLNHGITFNVNGSDQSLTDSNGKKLAPISYQNTTYLPVRAIANLTGIQVGFDAASQQIRLDTEQDVKILQIIGLRSNTVKHRSRLLKRHSPSLNPLRRPMLHSKWPKTTVTLKRQLRAMESI